MAQGRTWRKVFLYLIVLFVGLGLLSTLPLFGNKRLNRFQSQFKDKPPYKFPPGFLWGTATAAQQIEWQSPSDWTAFENRAFRKKLVAHDSKGHPLPGNIHNLDKMSLKARTRKSDFDTRYKSDIALMAKMGHNSYRFSISWSRLFPKEGQTKPSPQGIQFYQNILNTLKQHKIKPSATLFHFSSPAWLWKKKDGKRGWERADALQHFERFVRSVSKAFGAQIHHWCTLNEPMVFVYNGYMQGFFPPNEKRPDPSMVAGVVVQLLKAHTLAYQILKADAKQRGIKIEVGLTKHTRAFEPYRNYNALDRITAQLVEKSFVWDFMEALHTGVLKVTNTSFKQEIPGLKGTQDYVGVNYYGRFYVKSDILKPTKFTIFDSDPSDKRELTSDLGWSLYPHGMYNVLVEMHKRYKKPIYVLENGIADKQGKDKLRQHFLVTHLKEVWNAIHHGKVDVRGFFYWSFLDNFEWAEGFGPRFGLVHVNYNKDFARTPRSSAALFTQIIRANAISTKLWKTHHNLKPSDIKQ